MLILQGKECPYCGGATEFTDSSIIYGKSYGMIYLCKPCRAYVGVHKGTEVALGRLANAELREAKKEAHRYFDVIWKEGRLKRNEAYKHLSEYLGTSPEYTHIGMFDVEHCKLTSEWAKQKLNDLKRLDADFGVETQRPYYD